MPITGDQPGKGTYICTTCGDEINLDHSTETLSLCPNCDGSIFMLPSTEK